MPRPKICRQVSMRPKAVYFKPRGVPMRALREVCLTVEGCESLRLADLLGKSQQEAADSMGVSRHTFGRVLAEARGVVAEALVHGLALRIEGGDYALARKGPGRSEGAACNSIGKEVAMSKVAITTEGPDLEAVVDGRFGRAAGFLVVDMESGEARFVGNGDAQTRSQGAGIAAAETVAKAGAGVVLTGYVGPKAFAALAAAGIKVGQALERYKAGQVPIADGPNRSAGGGGGR